MLGPAPAALAGALKALEPLLKYTKRNGQQNTWHMAEGQLPLPAPVLHGSGTTVG